MKCYYPTDKSGNRIGFKTPEACIYDTSGTNLTNKLNQLRSDVNGKAAASHGNHVPAPQTANNKVYLRNDNTWHTITPSDIGAAASSHSHSWDSITSKPSLYTTSQIDSKVDAINSNITNISNEALSCTDYSSKWVLGTQNNHIQNIRYCDVIKKGHICTVGIWAYVKGTWAAGDEYPWIIGQLPKPLFEYGFQVSGWSYNATTKDKDKVMRFIFNEKGWLKPFYNHPDPTDGTEFAVYFSYITAD